MGRNDQSPAKSRWEAPAGFALTSICNALQKANMLIEHEEQPNNLLDICIVASTYESCRKTPFKINTINSSPVLVTP